MSQALRTGPERAFARADQLTGTYNPDPNFSFNGSGGAITIRNLSVGRYTVTFDGLNTATGNYQVTAYGTTSIRCKLDTWGIGVASVICTNNAGFLVNSTFLVSYTNDFRNQPDTLAAFLLADQPTSAGYNPLPAYSFNSTGQQNVVANVGTGRYLIALAGLNAAFLDADSGNAQVTAVGNDAIYCKLNGWAVPWTVAPADLWVGVLCFDSAGTPQNSEFSLQFLSVHTSGELWDRGFVWADQAQSTASSYIPSTTYNFNTLVQSNSVNTASRIGTGKYLVNYPDIPGWQLSTAMVSALGDDANYCNPAVWAQGNDISQMGVNCFNPSGTLVDSTFSAMYLRQESSCKDAVCNVVEHLVHPGRRQKRDNPILRGYATLNGLTGWQITTTGANPTETYGGSAAPMIVTSPPSIISEFAKSSFVPALTSATAVVYTSTLATRAGPWVNFPDNNDGSHVEVYPPDGWNSPYFAPGLVLPSDHSPVNVQMFDARGTSSTNLFVNDFLLTLDDNVLVVPIYVHVLRDNNNKAPAAYDGLFQAGTGTDVDVAWNIRQWFDLSTSRYRAGTIAFENNSVSMQAEKTLANPEAERNFNFGGGDDIFGQCDVQLRLAGVSFIRQGMGLEHTILANTPPFESPIQCGDQSFCDQSRVGILANQLLTAFDTQSGLPRGIHVVVGGAIWPGSSSSCGNGELGAPAGLTCHPESRGRTIFIDATGAANSENFFTTTIFHEIGHVLTSTAKHVLDDSNNLMAVHTATAGTFLNSSQCQSIHTRARSL